MSSSASYNSLAGAGNLRVRIIKTSPIPEQWTLVKETNMEAREPCEVSYNFNIENSPKLL